MKAEQRFRQNQRVNRHVLRKPFRFPEPRKLPDAALGKLLPGIPGVPGILKDIRAEFMTGKDEAGNEYELSEEEVDWKAIRTKLEKRLRELPGILPKELADYRKVIEYNETLPRTVHFSEPTTQKLRIDVRLLYKGFKRLYGLAANNIAVSAMNAADRFFSAAAENLTEYLKTGIEQRVPSEWINAVYATHMFGEKIVLAMANALADPDDAAVMFRDELRKTFPNRKEPFTARDEEIAKYVRLWVEGMALQDVADHYMEDQHPELMPGTNEYKQQKSTDAGMLGHQMRRALRRLEARLEDKT